MTHRVGSRTVDDACGRVEQQVVLVGLHACQARRGAKSVKGQGQGRNLTLCGVGQVWERVVVGTLEEEPLAQQFSKRSFNPQLHLHSPDFSILAVAVCCCCCCCEPSQIQTSFSLVAGLWSSRTDCGWEPGLLRCLLNCPWGPGRSSEDTCFHRGRKAQSPCSAAQSLTRRCFPGAPSPACAPLASNSF